MKRKLYLNGGMILLALSMFGTIFYMFNQIPEINDQAAVGNRIEFYKLPGKCIKTYKYKVIEPQTDGYALAVELRRLEFAPLDSPTTHLVMLYNSNNHVYYRDQIIKIPKDSCVRQVGVCKYGYSERSQRIVPLVQIMCK